MNGTDRNCVTHFSEVVGYVIHYLKWLWYKIIEDGFGCTCREAEFLDEIQTKVIRVFLLAIHSHVHHSFAYLFLQTHATSYSFYSALLFTLKEKGGKPDRKLHHLPYGLRNS